MGEHAYPSDGPGRRRCAASGDDCAVPVTATVRAIRDEDRTFMRRFVRERWGDEIVVAHGVVYRPHLLPGLIVTDAGEPVGLLTYTIDGEACEIVTIDAVIEGTGIGSLLIGSVEDVAREAGCSRLRLVTTNDNDRALGFYRAHGFDVVAVHEGAVDASRKLKPSIPLLNGDGVPIQDEIEMERRLSPGRGR
jgi:ribosomal protein S18 acetylase RimI-like enzyme